MKGKLAIACFVLSVTCGVAVADLADDCHSAGRAGAPILGGARLWVHPTEASLRACTEIIASPNFGSDEKALAYRYRGEMRMYGGAVQQAIADFTDSIRLKKENMAAFADRGWVRFTSGDSTGAIADYSEAIRLSPGSADLYNERGHIYVVNGKADDAIRDLTEALRLDPKRASALNTRGFAYAKKGDFVRAQKDYTAAITISPQAIYYANRGYLYEADGKRADAIKDLRKALELDPALIEAMNALKRLGVTETTATNSNRLIALGKEFAEKKCSNCHAVGANDVSRDKNATEFRNIYRHHPNLSLREPVQQAIHVTHAQMPPFNLSYLDIEAIVAYINSFVPQR